MATPPQDTFVSFRTRSSSIASLPGRLSASPNLSSTPANTRLRQSIQKLQRQSSDGSNHNTMLKSSSMSNIFMEMTARNNDGGGGGGKFSLPSSRPSSPVLATHETLKSQYGRNECALSPNNVNEKFVTLLSSVDFKQIDEMDPSLKDGSHVSFDGEIPIEIKMSEQSDNYLESGVLESVRTKILCKVHELCALMW